MPEPEWSTEESLGQACRDRLSPPQLGVAYTVRTATRRSIETRLIPIIKASEGRITVTTGVVQREVGRQEVVIEALLESRSREIHPSRKLEAMGAQNPKGRQAPRREEHRPRRVNGVENRCVSKSPLPVAARPKE